MRARAPDAFARGLRISAGAHFAVIGALAVAAAFEPDEPLFPASATFIELGMSGPNPTANLGAPVPAPVSSAPAEPEPDPPAPEPPAPEPAAPEPSPPPAPERPEVVRPTAENRDRMARPDARTRRVEPRELPDSGLRGSDAAWAESAPLESAPRDRRPIDTKARPTARRAAAGASGSGGIGLGGAPGGTRFDQDFEYSYYQRQMIARIQANWQQIPVRGERKVVIRFTIHKDGAISGAEVETSSGQPLLDRSAYRAVVLAEPMPPLPQSFPRDQVGVHLLFTYSGMGTASPDAGAAPAETGGAR